MGCDTRHRRAQRARGPLGEVVVRANGSVRIDGAAIFGAAEEDRAMTTAESSEMIDVLNRVKNWPLDVRMTLARRILETAQRPMIQEPPRTLSLDQVIGIVKTDAPPPTDEECERIMEEDLMRKYGI